MCSPHLEPAYGNRERVEKKSDNYEEPILESDFVSSPPKGDEIILNVYFNCWCKKFEVTELYVLDFKNAFLLLLYRRNWDYSRREYTTTQFKTPCKSRTRYASTHTRTPSPQPAQVIRLPEHFQKLKNSCVNNFLLEEVLIFRLIDAKNNYKNREQFTHCCRKNNEYLI